MMKKKKKIRTKRSRGLKKIKREYKEYKRRNVKRQRGAEDKGGRAERKLE